MSLAKLGTWRRKAARKKPVSLGYLKHDTCPKGKRGECKCYTYGYAHGLKNGGLSFFAKRLEWARRIEEVLDGVKADFITGDDIRKLKALAEAMRNE